MGPAKRLYFSGVSTLGIEWLKEKKSPLDTLIPFHHLVSDEPVPHIERLYAFKNTKQFEADLDWLLRHFKPVTLAELIQNRQSAAPSSSAPPSQRTPGSPSLPPHSGSPRFLITFDDALRQVYEVAAPILLRKGITAALFVNPAFVDNKELFYDLKKGLILDKLANLPTSAQGPARSSAASPASLNRILAESAPLFSRPAPFDSIATLETAIRNINYLHKELTDRLGTLLELDFTAFLKNSKPFMTRDEIAALAKKGFEIGAHSIDHPLYALVSPEEQLRQTRVSVDWVEDNFAPPYRTFAFPHVDTGVGQTFFHELTATPSSPLPGHTTPPPSPSSSTAPRPLDLILGNTTGMMEQNPRVVHRFIGENPAIPIEKMAKAVLAYSIFRKKIGKSYIQRS